MENRTHSILENGVRICELYKANIDLLKQGSLIPGLVLVYWEIKAETGNMSQQLTKREYWERAKELRPEASRGQLVDTAIALFVYEKIMNERL